jgi:hypothetical protein
MRKIKQTMPIVFCKRHFAPPSFHTSLVNCRETLPISPLDTLDDEED